MRKPTVITLSVLALLTLTACQDPIYRQLEFKTVEVPAELFNQCPTVKIPKKVTVTEGLIADIMFQLKTANAQCRNAIYAIRKTLAEQNAIIKR